MPTPSPEAARLHATHVSTQQCVALLMGGHRRLGARSRLRFLPAPILRLAAEFALWPVFDARFVPPITQHRMASDRREIGWNVEDHQTGFVQVAVEQRVRTYHRIARLELTYTGVDDGAVFRCGGVELRLRAVDDEDLDENYLVPRTYALLNGRHVPRLDGCWSVQKRIAVDVEVDTLRGTVAFAVDGVPVGGASPLTAPDWRENGVEINAEDHSDGAALDGEDEWRATVAVKAPERAKRPPPVLCADATCFCRRARDLLPQVFG